MRNNEDRLGSKKTQASSPAATQAATGPAPLDFVLSLIHISEPTRPY